MTNYEKLLEEAEHEGLYVIEQANFQSRANGLINGDVIGLSKNLQKSVKRGCVLAEELGHHHTTYGNILDQSDVMNQKQEFRARVWAYQRLVTMDKLIAAYQKGCRNSFEIAEELEVTEEFLSQALAVFKQKYYPYTQYKDYLIKFEPMLQIYKFAA